MDTIYFNGSTGMMPPNYQPQSKLIIESGGYIGCPEKTITISISKFNELLNNPEWKLLDTYIKNDCRTYSWINKKTGEIINDGMGLNPPGYKLEIKQGKK